MNDTCSSGLVPREAGKRESGRQTMLVSIFNDVIGPVMRGPSSSHCAAALRIGRLARDLVGGTPDDVLVEFDRAGSLPTTHESQGSDMGLFGGLLGWEAADPRLPGSGTALRDAGTRVRIETVDVGDPHPNTYRLTLTRHGQSHTLRAISTGGGMVEVIDIDGWSLSLHGDYHETLVVAGSRHQAVDLAARIESLAGVAIDARPVRGLVRLLAVKRGVNVHAARDDQAVQRADGCARELGNRRQVAGEGRKDHDCGPRRVDCLDVRSRYQNGRHIPGPPTCGLEVTGEADDGAKGHARKFATWMPQSRRWNRGQDPPTWEEMLLLCGRGVP
jgi:iron-sulfur-dependent L-serine dehydratase beta subunit